MLVAAAKNRVSSIVHLVKVIMSELLRLGSA